MKPNFNFEKELKGFEATLEILEKYIDYHDGFLHKEVNETYKRLQQEKYGKEIEDQINLENLYHEFTLSYLESTFPDIQNKMTLVILFSVFEGMIKTTCTEIGNALRTPISYSDLRGPLIPQCMKFLTKFCGVNQSLFGNQGWQKIDSIRIIRNAIVHNESEVSNLMAERKHIMAQFSNVNGFYIFQDHVVFKTSDFSKYFISLLKDFFYNLHDEFKRNQVFNLN